jgi:hypothetical protein
MQNLVEILGVTASPRAIIPCIRVSKGIWAAAADHKAPFQMELQVVYQVSGRQLPAVKVTVAVSTMTLHRIIDARNVDLHATITIPDPPDPGSSINANARLVILDGGGQRVEVSDLDSGNFRYGG